MTPRRWAVAGLVVAAGCAIKVGRDLSSVPVQQIVYDDMCGLQGYFDEIAAGIVRAPRVVRSSELERTEGMHAAGGVTTIAFETKDQLDVLRRVLSDNWKNVPQELLNAPRVEIEVRWAEKAAVRRAVTDDHATVTDGHDSWHLAYHVCLSELLFGAPLYATRRQLMGLPPIAARPPDAGSDGRLPIAPDMK